MRVTALKTIMDLDERINTIHDELATLYAERLAITVEEPPKKADKKITVAKRTATNAMRKDWARTQYDKLQSVWRCYDLTLPPIAKLRSKLEKSYNIVKELENAEPQLIDKLAVVLVPPSSALPFPVSNKLRYSQGFSDGQDYVTASAPKLSASRDWRVLVIYAGEHGLSYGTSSTILKTKSYCIADYDTRALGAAEYAALSLQYQQPIDDGTWTLLLKSVRKNEPVLSAGFHAGRFRFDTDEADAGFDIDTYRPAVEVNV